MDIFDNLANGIVAVATPMNLLLLFAGVMLGMIVGVMPGLGPSAGLAILLPLTFTLDPTGAVVMLAAVYYGAMYGGTITSVLINTPGESATVASTFDGYPLAKQGRAGPALVMAAIGSFVAGTIGAVLISIASPATASLAATFGPPELFLVVVLGLLTLIVIIGGNRLLGALSALIGFGIATVGIDIGTGQQRYTFGSVELINGIDFIPVAIGLFGVGEILHTLWRGGHLEKLAYFNVSARSRGFWPTRTDLRESAGPITRGSFLGFFVGATPGAGATVASLMSYNLEKSVSKTPEKFGKGAMAGLTGPEAANNAASSGAMVPLLTLGIPGSASTAVLIGGFMMWGLQPGPLLMTQNPEFAWGLIASMFLGNIMLLLVNVFCIPAFASIARVPFRVLGPTIIVICVLGTFTVNGSIVEVAIMLACGVLGFFMRRFGLSPAAMVIALVLGPMAEESLRQTMIISGGTFGIFWDRTTSQVLIALIVLLLVLPLVTRLIKRAAARIIARLGAMRRRHARGGTPVPPPEDLPGPSGDAPTDGSTDDGDRGPTPERVDSR
ncbi:tripartite tricarboxylate transporter permease [Nocardioides sp. zg-1228]|uniref:tripartite tricarboxylate transporter permease n=1 Tax=Nocardioides sp. zg-1228 TaxID=2763008 RepID=UPI001642C7BD|nr:tripartite tricarboxylate transporter permease [Nocardioides sp. zg-1228]MBC2931974.1 tripartite tricarboxylate transporter permease [Nocardioides sp. zg-1228]QSF57530.1 tripartite tricarboxylate transporter permease [Nocardioides sp. zg-1228]